MARPLPVSFLLVGIFGTLIFGLWTYSGRVSKTWGITMVIFCLVLFIASLVSLEPEELPKRKTKRKSVKPRKKPKKKKRK